MPTTIYLVRHAQGIHNLKVENHKFVDPDLTELGNEQCGILKSQFPDHAKVTYLVASPMRRTLYTALQSFTPFDPSSPAAKEHPKVLANPLLQEVSTNPCDYGSPVAKIVAEFGDKVDFSRVDDSWTDKSKGSRWAPNMNRLQTRAREARVWLRELAGGADTDVHIVVVTHGGFLHFLTDDYDGLSHTYGELPGALDPAAMSEQKRRMLARYLELSQGTGWNNTEYRSYHFADLTGKDPEAHLTETKESWRKRRGSGIPLTESEQMELRAVVKEVLKNEFSEFRDEDEDEDAVA